jgi:hypothetical protein
MTRSGDVDLSFRPATYWPKSLTTEQLLSRVKGKARRDIARKVLEEQGFPGLSTFLARQELPPSDRAGWGATHPDFMGGEYLPSLEDGEVEIVRVSLASTTADQISICARRAGAGIEYRVVGEYEEDQGMHYQIPFKRSEQPLTLGELIRLMDGSHIPGDIYAGGLVVSNWESGFSGNNDVEEAMRFVKIESSFYPQLAAYYGKVAEGWCDEHQQDDDASAKDP